MHIIMAGANDGIGSAIVLGIQSSPKRASYHSIYIRRNPLCTAVHRCALTYYWYRYIDTLLQYAVAGNMELHKHSQKGGSNQGMSSSGEIPIMASVLLF